MQDGFRVPSKPRAGRSLTRIVTFFTFAGLVRIGLGTTQEGPGIGPGTTQERPGIVTFVTFAQKRQNGDSGTFCTFLRNRARDYPQGSPGRHGIGPKGDKSDKSAEVAVLRVLSPSALLPDSVLSQL